MDVNINELKSYIFENIKSIPQSRIFDYTIFGKEVEDYVVTALKNYFLTIDDKLDCYIAPDKNYFPDFTLNKNIAFEIKAARNEANPENDMGTLNSWESKINLYGDNIYYIFIKYGCDEDGTVNKIDSVYVDKVYKFIGQNSAKTLKYREKDGNLRPKSWEDFNQNKFFVSNLPDFKAKLKETDIYRAYRIIDKKIEYIKSSTEHMKKLYEKYFTLFKS